MFNENNSIINSFLTFKIDSENIAVNSNQIRKILDPNLYGRPTQGSINNIIRTAHSDINVFDLKNEETCYTNKTCLIIFSPVEFDFIFIFNQNFAIIVDEVLSLIEIYDHQIVPGHIIDRKYFLKYIDGVIKHGNEFFKILNIEKMVWEENNNIVRMKRKNVLV